MHIDPETIDWLMEGDPAIRWQVMRDLLDAPETEWQAERQKVATEGWGARLLSHQNPDGGWGKGVYSPKWTSTTYSLLSLREIGLPGDCEPARLGARIAMGKMLGEQCDTDFHKRLAELDRCIVGMILTLSVYFGIEDDRVEAVVENLLAERMEDGGWNCRKHRKPYPHHSSFHTTLNVLDGLREYAEQGGNARNQRANAPLAAAVQEAERDAREFLLIHRLFRSDKTGNIIRTEFTKMSSLYRWHYDFFRALDYFARSGAEKDPRMEEGIDLLRQYRLSDGRWSNQKTYEAKTFFPFETAREPSRINTLRALRVLKWWEKQ